MSSKVLFFRSKVLAPTTLRRPSTLTTGRVRPVYRYGRFPNTPTMPAEPILPPISPVVDRGSPAPAQNPVKSLKPHPPLTTQYTHMWAYTTGICIRQLPQYAHRASGKHNPPNTAQSWPGHPRDPPKTRSKVLNKYLPCPLIATRCSYGWAYATGIYILQLPQYTHRAIEPHNPTNTAHS